MRTAGIAVLLCDEAEYTVLIIGNYIASFKFVRPVILGFVRDLLLGICCII
ncbi:hypothetical protein D3C85_1621880 [compost metagenome]